MSRLRRGPVVALMVTAVAVSSAVAAQPVHAATPTAPGAFVTTAPTRVLDTRHGIGGSGPIGAGATLGLKVEGVGPVPATGVAAVMLNVTVAQPMRAGDVIVYADGTTRPGVSNVNFVAGQTVPNSVVAPVGADGKVDFYNQSTGTTHLIADVSGYFLGGTTTGAGLYTPVTPARVLDTRYGVGGASRVAANGTVVLTVAGRGGVPSGSTAGAVVVNVTVTSPAQAGHVTVWADGATRPTTSNVNFVAGQTVPNLVVAPVGADGKVDLLNASNGTTQLIADVSGYFRSGTATSAGAYVQISPMRLLDTRQGYPITAPKAGQSASLPVTGQYQLPISNVSAAVVDAVVTQPATAGDLVLYPSGSSVPSTSNVNFVKGGTSANLAAVPLSATGAMGIANQSAGSIQVIVDVFGYFVATAPPPFTAQTLAVPAPASGKEAPLLAVSCADVSDCVAVGKYYANSHTVAFAETLAGGTWTVSYPPVPGGMTDTVLTGISCPVINSDTTTCIAVGSAQDAGGDSSSLVETLAAGSWTASVLPKTAGDQDGLAAVSCVVASQCTAVGSRSGTTTSGGLVETMVTGTWTETDLATPTAAEGDGPLTGVSCTAATACVAVGSYLAASSQSEVPWSATLSGTTWTTTAVSLSAAGFTGVSCPSSGVCLATTDGPAVEQLSGGTWSTQTLPVYLRQSAVSCAGTSSCETGGYTTYDPQGDERAAVGLGAPGSLAVYSPPIPPNTQVSFIEGISCVTGGCVAVGFGSPAAFGTTVVTPIVETLTAG